MESPLTAGHQEKPAQVTILDGPESKELSDFIQEILDENSAQDVIEIDIHVSALADYVQRGLKERGFKDLVVEGQEASDWVLIDAGDVILHVFRPEVRVFYNLEKMWSVPLPKGLDGVKEQAPEDTLET